MIQVPSVAGRSDHRAEIQGLEARITGLGPDLRNFLAKPNAKLVQVPLPMAAARVSHYNLWSITDLTLMGEGETNTMVP